MTLDLVNCCVEQCACYTQYAGGKGALQRIRTTQLFFRYLLEIEFIITDGINGVLKHRLGRRHIDCLQDFITMSLFLIFNPYWVSV